MDILFSLRNAMLRRFMPGLRSKRMALFEELMNVKPGMRVLDLGGTAFNWQWCSTPLDITIINLPGFPTRGEAGIHKLTFVEGDATDMPQYGDNSFDLVFSNSVIEHVGGPAKEADFAKEARRIAPAYFIQTPSKYFPYEPHTGLPFWWYYPDSLRNKVLRGWEKRLPEFGEMIKGTTYIDLADFQRYFPEGRLHVERMAGFPKSYTLYRPVGVTGQA